jgi:hypothetical protein
VVLGGYPLWLVRIVGAGLVQTEPKLKQEFVVLNFEVNMRLTNKLIIGCNPES